ncbi:MAG: oligosaccharide flippase family protein [Candidatus Magasanikbacteria bacterium]|nr:oligosaccharide flippase family protein [Candidatus Magasanikbacteria bacterium]
MLNFFRSKIKAFLLWSQKYTKTDMLYITKSGFWITLNNGYAIFAGLTTSILFANLLSPENYGVFKYILALSATISGFSLTAGMNKALIPAFAKGFDGMYKKAFWVRLKGSLIIPVVAASTAIFYFLHGQTLLGSAMLIIGLFSPFQECVGIYMPYLSGKKNFKLISIYNIIQTSLYLLTITAALLLTTQILVIIFLYFLINTAVVSFYYFYTPKIIKLENNLIDQETFNFAKHLTLINVLTSIANQIDKILVFHFLGPAKLAIYAFATKPVDMLSDITKGLLKDISLPKLSAKTIQEIKAGLTAKMLRLFILSLMLIIIYIIAVPYVFKLIFPQYLESIKYSQVLSLAIILTMDVLIAQTFFAHAKKKELYVVNTANSITKIVLYLVLLPIYGLWGLVASRLAAQGVYFVLLLFLFRRYR